jgi:hypothetical protein
MKKKQRTGIKKRAEEKRGQQCKKYKEKMRTREKR